MTQFEPTRTAALACLSGFLPKAGKTYAAQRNFDYGPTRHDTAVSRLSPYLRHRVLTEEEVLEAVLGRFSLSSAEKFVQEVFWRTYWKGWLQLRPSVWDSYRAGVSAQLDNVKTQSGLLRGWQAACLGETGIDAFDHWARELVETGYLHNHARMWFASIWIFTLRLPWELGADFFLRHLLDGDPASNTLSWRWVAGLQTKGKTYLARPDNIAKYTEGRFRPSGLAGYAPALTGPDHPPPLAPPAPTMWDASETSALLLTSDDMSPGALCDAGLSPVATATWHDAPHLSPLQPSPCIGAFKQGLLHDATTRWGARLGPVQTCDNIEALAAWARESGARQIVTLFAPAGPTAIMLDQLEHALAEQDQRLVRVLRPYDARCWSHATHGFFRFKEKIPKFVGAIKGVAPA